MKEKAYSPEEAVRIARIAEAYHLSVVLGESGELGEMKKYVGWIPEEVRKAIDDLGGLECSASEETKSLRHQT